MARYNAQLPNEIIKEIEAHERNCKNMFEDMTQEGAKVVYNLVLQNMKSAFASTESLEKGLTFTRAYRTKDGSVNTYVGFYGYDGKPTTKYPKGTPIPLMAMAREYGTYGSNKKTKHNPRNKKGVMPKGEKKNPFFRKSFKKKDIEEAMLKVQERYLGNE